jgi:hypothetical protein
MKEAIIGLISAFGVVIIKGIIDYVMGRRKRKDKLEDDKTGEDNEVLKAIKDLKSDVEGVKRDVANVKAEVEKTRKEVKGDILEESVVQSRVRILRFADEMTYGQKHSKDHFDQTLDDITKYENYCSDHPNFKNDITKTSIELIRDAFKERMKKHDFL